MAKINKKNYNTPGFSGFENSPAKVWHVNALVGTTIGYKSIAGYINFIAGNNESVTILSNDTGFPDSNITVTKTGGDRSWLFLNISLPGNIARNYALLATLNVADELNTHVQTMSTTINPSSTETSVIYDFKIQRIAGGAPSALNMGGVLGRVIYFEFKLFI